MDVHCGSTEGDRFRVVLFEITANPQPPTPALVVSEMIIRHARGVGDFWACGGTYGGSDLSHLNKISLGHHFKLPGLELRFMKLLVQ